jgi:hypothetical protein
MSVLQNIPEINISKCMNVEVSYKSLILFNLNWWGNFEEPNFILGKFVLNHSPEN